MAIYSENRGRLFFFSPISLSIFLLFLSAFSSVRTRSLSLLDFFFFFLRPFIFRILVHFLPSFLLLFDTYYAHICFVLRKSNVDHFGVLFCSVSIPSSFGCHSMSSKYPMVIFNVYKYFCLLIISNRKYLLLFPVAPFQ